MKLVLVLVVGMMTILGCTKQAKLDSDVQKASYAIGMQIGSNLKQQNVDFDADALFAGLMDAKGGKESKLNEEQRQQAMMKLQEATLEKQKAEGEKNKKTGEDFLAKNKTSEGVKATDSGLQYKVISEGKGKKPKSSNTVKVNYKGTLISGEEFDSSYKRGEPAEFPLDGVIKGWTEGLQLMTEGSKYQFFIPAELAYGSMPRPGIPANSTLIFEVELLEVVK